MLDRVLAPRAGIAYVVLRIAVGLMFAFHGMQKVFGVFGLARDVMSQLWIGGVIELATGVMVAFGLGTRWAAFVASGTMAVAYVQFHWQFRLDENLLPAINHGELALVYALLFLFIACQGTRGGRVGQGVPRG